MIKLTCFDSAFATWGMAKLLVSPDGGIIQVVDLALTKTEKEDGKQVRKSSDDIRRGAETYAAAKRFALWADLIAAEVPTGGKTARVAKGFGISTGLLIALMDLRPLVQVDQSEVKRAATGRRTATKDEMILWATGRFPDAPWLRFRDRPDGRLIDANEHLADAIAVGEAALKTTEFRSAAAMLNSVRAQRLVAA